MTWVLVAVGGACGAVLRLWVTTGLAQRLRALAATSRLPAPVGLSAGTFVVNVVGSFVLGTLGGVGSADLRVLLGTGFCGGLTTFSTFVADTLGLAALRRPLAVGYVLVMLAAGFGAVAAGVALAG
jgi:CrcB protein